VIEDIESVAIVRSHSLEQQYVEKQALSAIRVQPAIDFSWLALPRIPFL